MDAETNDLRNTLSELLAREIPVHVAERAARERRYCYHLIAARSNQAWIQQLIDLEASGEQPIRTEHSSVRLGVALAASIGRHAFAGFKAVDAEVLSRRWSACQACPHLVEPPDSLVYHLGRRVVVGEGDDERICGRCGCFALPKARKATEECPVADPNNHNRTRWGEARNPVG